MDNVIEFNLECGFKNLFHKISALLFNFSAEVSSVIMADVVQVRVSLLSSVPSRWYKLLKLIENFIFYLYSRTEAQNANVRAQRGNIVLLHI